MNKNEHRGGFTLIELLVALAVAAILITTAVPTFTTVIRDNRLATQANEMLAALMYARSEASKRQATVRVCAAGASCDGSWNDGWIVYAVDDDEVLQEWPPLAGEGLTLAAKPVASFIEYAGDGTVNAKRTLVFCDARGAASARAVNISATGRAAMARREGGDGDQIVDDVEGEDVECPQ